MFQLVHDTNIPRNRQLTSYRCSKNEYDDTLCNKKVHELNPNKASNRVLIYNKM